MGPTCEASDTIGATDAGLALGGTIIVQDHAGLMREYEEALGTHKWEAIEPLIDDDASFVFTEGTFVGKAEIEAAIRKTFSLIQDETYRVSDLDWVHVNGDCALCRYVFHWSGLIDGNHCEGEGRGTSFLVRRGDRWRIKHEHLGPPPA